MPQVLSRVAKKLEAKESLEEDKGTRKKLRTAGQFSPFAVPKEDFENYGAEIMKCHNVEQASFKEHWTGFSAIDPIIFSAVWDKMLPFIELEENGLHPEHLMWAVLFLTQYTNEKDLASKCDGVHEDTFASIFG